MLLFVVVLCKAHIVNEAFRDSARAWTVQRQDVDSFFGSNFESDFIATQYFKDRPWDKLLTDKTLSKLFSPKILVDDKPVDHFVAQGTVPEEYTRLEIDNNEQTITLGLKMPPDAVLAAVGQRWEIEVSKDVRLPALVSLIKAAHLTLFEMLGYHYALSGGGYFVGRQILGEFFLRTCGKPKTEVLEIALPYFREFAHMVRPVVSSGLELQGTISDGTVVICSGSGSSIWALIVFVKTSESLHAVMIPVLDTPEAAATFMSFLHSENETVEAKLGRFEQNQWKIDNRSGKMSWPKTGILYPQ